MAEILFRRYSDSFWWAYHPTRPIRFELRKDVDGKWELRSYKRLGPGLSSHWDWELLSIHGLYWNWDETRQAIYRRLTTTYEEVQTVLWRK